MAAVLGVVITMGALGGPPEEIGHKVAAALVGTFLGILLCYGFLGPLALNMTKMNDAELDYLRCLRARRDRVREGIGSGAGGGVRAAQHSRRACALPSRNWKPRAAEAAPARLRRRPSKWPRVAQPIIIIRKKVDHGGHHGGAWKVAYADFVTAMMALFIVLWLLNSSEQVRKAISAYFQDPSGTGSHSGSASTGTGETVSVGKDNMDQPEGQAGTGDQEESGVRKAEGLRIQMSVTGEGLRVEMMESEKGIFFESGSAKPSENGARADPPPR